MHTCKHATPPFGHEPRPSHVEKRSTFQGAAIKITVNKLSQHSSAAIFKTGNGESGNGNGEREWGTGMGNGERGTGNL